MLGMNNTHCIFHDPLSTHTLAHAHARIYSFFPTFWRDQTEVFQEMQATCMLLALQPRPVTLPHCAIPLRKKCIMDSSLRDRMPTMSSWDQPNRKSKDDSEYQESLIFLLRHLPWDALLQHTKVKYQSWSRTIKALAHHHLLGEWRYVRALPSTSGGLWMRKMRGQKGERRQGSMIEQTQPELDLKRSCLGSKFALLCLSRESLCLYRVARTF